jgi:hypothetical protein
VVQRKHPVNIGGRNQHEVDCDQQSNCNLE